MVFDHQGEHASQSAAISSIAAKIGCPPETLRHWVRQAERDQGRRAGPTTAASASGRWSAKCASCANQRDPQEGIGVFCDGGARPPVKP